ncbi:MAG TPA: FAD-binding oxidoreductase [Aestuariivirgaceae bacterium]|nr:FAD-binding oxidoreductase [Aestuariivirgaceae bacterium]
MPAPLPVSTDEALPARTGVVVVGGGIVGAATALELAERGVDVVLCEKGEFGAEQSGRNWGWCRQVGRDPREIPLILESLKAWRGMNARVEAETGFRQSGIVYLLATDGELTNRMRWYENNAKPFGLNVHPLAGTEAEALVPGARVKWHGALFSPDDGRAEPHMAVAAIAAAARRRGARLLKPCAVRGIETAAGRVSGVVTERGPIACDAVVVAAGAWSRLFLGNAGVDFPQLAVVNSVMRTAPLDAGHEHSASGMKFAFRKRLDGGYTVSHRHLSVADIVPESFSQFFRFLPVLLTDRKGLRLRLGGRFFEAVRLKRRWAMDEVTPFEDVRILDPEPVAAILAEAEASLKQTFPAFAGLEIVERWAGCIDATPDAVPVISAIESRPGLYLASGFSGHGFGLGPGAGRLMADLVTGRPPVVDPRPYRYGRYFDGTRPRPTTGL